MHLLWAYAANIQTGMDQHDTSYPQYHMFSVRNSLNLLPYLSLLPTWTLCGMNCRKFETESTKVSDEDRGKLRINAILRQNCLIFYAIEITVGYTCMDYQERIFLINTLWGSKNTRYFWEMRKILHNYPSNSLSGTKVISRNRYFWQKKKAHQIVFCISHFMKVAFILTWNMVIPQYPTLSYT